LNANIFTSCRRSSPVAHLSCTSIQRCSPRHTNSGPNAGWRTLPSIIGSCRSRAARECVWASTWLGWNCGYPLRTYFVDLR
jgi:hypothetical protein